jgi:hypothetical protein
MSDHKNNPKISNAIIVVSGLPRSGTSMMMNMLESGGLELLTDGIRKADDDNPLGYYEYEAVKRLKEGDTSWVKNARGKVIKIISYLLTNLPEKNHYYVIFMQRDLDEVLASQRKMIIRRGENPDKIDDEKMKTILQNHLNEIDAWIDQQDNITRIDMPYKEIVNDPQLYIEQLTQFLGFPLDTDSMIRVVNPDLYRQRG